MKQPTLEEFIAAYGTGTYLANLYVREKGFKQLYVRMTPRWIEGVGVWTAVPRHFIALHGLKAQEFPQLAKKYGFAKAL